MLRDDERQARRGRRVRRRWLQRRLVMGATLAATALALGLAGSAASAGNLVPAGRQRPPLVAEIWTDRGRDGIYHPGETVGIRFRVNDDAYVCVYDIDTEGRVRVIFPLHAGEDGWVEGGRSVALPPRGADFDYVASGPPGLEMVGIVASRRPLRDPWGPWAGTAAGWAEPEEWYELDDADTGDGYDDDDDAYDDGDAYDDDDAYGHGGDGTYEDAGAPYGWPVHGLLVTGDPFAAMTRIDRRLLRARLRERDLATDYARFHVSRRVRYPRYLCGDCHGGWRRYDPYADRCAVFSVRVNLGWRYRHHRLTVIEYDRVPRYIYVRHQHVPRRYRSIKRRWGSNERHDLHRRFRRDLDREVVPRQKSTWSRPKSGRAAKSKAGYAWKTEPRQPRHTKRRAAGPAQLGSGRAGHEKRMSSSKGKREASRKRKGKGRGKGKGRSGY